MTKWIPLTLEHKFKCIKCGNCCRGAGKHLEFLWSEKDVMDKLFPPCYQIIIKVASLPVGLFIKDNQGNIHCPYLYGNKCVIYQERPITCRTYPLSLSERDEVLVDIECPGVNTEEGISFDKMIERLFECSRRCTEEVLERITEIVILFNRPDRIDLKHIPGVFLIKKEHTKKDVMTFYKLCNLIGISVENGY